LSRDLALLADALKQHTCRLVVRILGDELALEGALENGLPQTFSVGEGGVDGGSDLVG
jgi:hypothetical protein